MPGQKAGDDGAGAGRRRDRDAPPSAPRWVRLSAIAVGVLILLVVLAKLTGVAGDHGPGRHLGGERTSATVHTFGQHGFR